jgi:hypothetical protein
MDKLKLSRSPVEEHLDYGRALCLQGCKHPLQRSEREREIKRERESGRERGRERERKREGEREGERGRLREREKERVFIFKRNDGCSGTF